MVQLLIVDDETSVVDSLAITISWQEIGIDKVYKAYSAYEAIDILSTTFIDIVITDIRMPGMSGLELIEQIRKDWSQTKCILLSGHADFAYAQEAISHQVSGYLLKPISDETLVTTMRTIVDMLNMEWKEKHTYNRVVKILQENNPKLKEELLNELLHGRQIASDELIRKLETLGLHNFQNQSFAIMLIRMEGKFVDYGFNSLSLMEYAVGNIAEELFAEYFTLWKCKDIHGYLVFLVQFKEGNEHLAQQLDQNATQLQSSVSQYLKGSISILLSRKGVFPSDISALYHYSLSRFRRLIGNESELLISAPNEIEQIEIRSLQSLYEPPLLINLLEAGLWDMIAEKLENIFEELMLHWIKSQEHLKEVFFSISAAFSYVAHKSGRELADMIGNDLMKLVERPAFQTVKALRDWTFQVLQQLRGEMENETKTARISIVMQVQEFVQANLSDDVSLQAIADQIHLHPVYISKVFKIETKENLSDYLNRLRMEKSIYLLKNSQAKIYEIAMQLGYSNPTYFIKVFKKYYGLTPQEFRNH